MEPLRIIPKVWPDIERRRYLQDLFAERYSDFMRWALQLSRGDRGAAEEIVHDAYVNFARTLPDLHLVDNLDGYIYDSLRNLNNSRKRRAWKHNHESLDILEFDSLKARLRMRGRADSLELRDQLERLCIYLCWRKQSVRSASLLLLRFFRNYYPEEIARVARLSRPAVNVQIGRARHEAREYLDNASRSNGGMEHSVKVPLARDGRVEGVEDLIRRFTDIIRLNRNGDCFSSEQMQRFYGSDSTCAPDTEELAHLVSCDECLSRIAGFMNGGSSEDDNTTLRIEGDSRQAAENAMRVADEEIREFLDHDPSVLILAVNGEDVLQYSVTPAALEQIYSVPPSTDLKFVEVFDRVDQRLLKVDVTSVPPQAPVEVRCEVVLAGDRTLCLVIEWYDSYPSIRLEYSAAPTEDSVEFQALALVPSPAPIRANDEALAVINAGHLPGRLWKRMRGWLRIELLIPVVVVFTFLLFWSHNVKVNPLPKNLPDTAVILASSERAEAAIVEPLDVSHRTIAFEERTGDGSIVEKGRIEIWRGGERTAKRFYDGRGKLAAGEWKHGTSPELVLKDGRLQSRVVGTNCGNGTGVWSCDLSAAAFAGLGNSGDDWKVEELKEEYVVHLVRTSSVRDAPAVPRLIRADLHIDRSTLRTRQEGLWIESDGEVHEYRLTEVSFDPRTRLKTDSPILRPDADLKQQLPEHSSLSRRSENPLVQSALAHLQLQVLSRLHDVNADVGKPLTVERTSDGRITIRGVLSTDQDAKIIRSAIADLAADSRLNEKIYSVGDLRASKRQRTENPMVIEQYEVDAEQCPAEAMLRTHFQSLGYRGSQLDEQIHQYTQNVLGQSARALQEAWTLHQFSQSFSAKELASLSIDDQRTWAALLEEHSQSLAASLEVLRRSVEWIHGKEAGSSDLPVVPQRAVPLATDVESVLTQTTEINHSLRSMFMVSADGDAPTTPPDFPRLLSAVQSDLLRVQTASRQYSASMRLSNQ